MKSQLCARRRGRPKTKYYTTVMARIPIHLALQVQGYSTDHNLSLSAIIRLGLTALLCQQSIPIPAGGPEKLEEAQELGLPMQEDADQARSERP